MGDPEGVRPHALALRDLSEKRSTPRLYASNGLTPITYLSCLGGDWKAARDYSDRGLELASIDPLLLLLRVMLEHETGEPAQGETYLERLLELMRRTGPTQLLSSGRTSMAIPAIARITGVPGRPEIAEAAAEAILSGRSVTPVYAMYARAGLALLAVQKGDQAAAEEHYAILLGLGQRDTMLWTVSSVDRLLGLLSQTVLKLEQATAHFEDALAFCRKAGYRPELAWTGCDYAGMLVQRDGDGDRAKAITLLGESLAIASELGMRPLMERVLALQEKAAAQPVRGPAHPDGLSQREVEVLRLIAFGRTDRVVAEELIISTRTVGNHVGSILNKTGAANRTEAATYAAHRDPS